MNYFATYESGGDCIKIWQEDARVRGTLKAARMRPSGNSLTCVHLPFADILKWARRNMGHQCGVFFLAGFARARWI